jgi:hypothetical protein
MVTLFISGAATVGSSMSMFNSMLRYCSFERPLWSYGRLMSTGVAGLSETAE